MTITKRQVATHSSDINGRIQVKIYNQVIDTIQDEDGEDVIDVIRSIPETSVIDPSMGDYDAKVKALGLKLVGSLAGQQETLLRDKEQQLKEKTAQCQMAEDMCAKHCKTIEAQDAEIKQLKADK